MIQYGDTVKYIGAALIRPSNMTVLQIENGKAQCMYFGDLKEPTVKMFTGWYMLDELMLLKKGYDNTNAYNHLIAEIVKGINFRETIIFCGVGISRNSGMPVVQQLVPYILKKFDIPDNVVKVILDIIPFEAFMETLYADTLLDRVFDVYGYGSPNTNHHFIANLVKDGRINTVVTTNFDCLIEKALLETDLREGIDFEVIFRDSDFEKIDWTEKRIRIVKIHGSIADRRNMAFTLKQVASQVLSKSRMSIIRHVFSEGTHKNVLVLGYSCSDIFDLSPLIEGLEHSLKNVDCVQHITGTSESDFANEAIAIQQEKNPFKNFVNGKRIFINTDRFVETVWRSLIPKTELKQSKSEINWKAIVDKWVDQIIIEKSEAIIPGLRGAIYDLVGSYDLAIENYLSALRIATIIDFKVAIGTWCNALGMLYTNLGEYGVALDFLNQGMMMPLSNEDQEAALGNIGNCYTFLGEYTKAREFYIKALDLAKEIDDKPGEGLWLANLGSLFQYQMDFDNAETYMKRALEISRETGDKKSEGSFIGNIGNLMMDQGNHHAAMDYHLKALNIAKEIGDKKAQALWCLQLGNVSSNIGAIGAGIGLKGEALELFQHLREKKGEGSCLGALGKDYAAIGELDLAMEYFYKAVEIEREIGNKKELAMSLVNIALIYSGKGEAEKARPFFLEASQLSRTFWA